MDSKKNKKDQIAQKRKQNEARREYYRRLKPLIFAFVAWFILLTILHLPFFKNHLRTSMIFFTQQSALLLGRLLFLPLSATGGSGLAYDGFGMNIILECTAYNFYLFVIVITFFARWSLKDKIINLAFFIVVLFMANNARFFVMGAIGKYHPQLFHSIHDFVWNILFGFLVFIIFYYADRRAGGIFAPIEELATSSR